MVAKRRTEAADRNAWVATMGIGSTARRTASGSHSMLWDGIFIAGNLTNNRFTGRDSSAENVAGTTSTAAVPVEAGLPLISMSLGSGHPRYTDCRPRSASLAKTLWLYTISATRNLPPLRLQRRRPDIKTSTESVAGLTSHGSDDRRTTIQESHCACVALLSSAGEHVLSAPVPRAAY